MANYLDEAGLILFWRKIRDRITDITSKIQKKLAQVSNYADKLNIVVFGKNKPAPEEPHPNGLYYNVEELMKFLYNNTFPVDNKENIDIIRTHTKDIDELKKRVKGDEDVIGANQNNIKGNKDAIDALKKDTAQNFNQVNQQITNIISEKCLDVDVRDHTLVFFDSRKK